VSSSHSVTSRSITVATVTFGGGGAAGCADVCVQPATTMVNASAGSSHRPARRNRTVKTDAKAKCGVIRWQCGLPDARRTIGQWPHLPLPLEHHANPRRLGDRDLRLSAEAAVVHADMSISCPETPDNWTCKFAVGDD